MRRGEIYLIDFDGHGSEQSGSRPALVVQNDKGNQNSPTTIVCPITSKTKRPLPTHVALETSDGVVKSSIVLCEQVRVVDKSLLQRKLGEVTNQEKICEVNRALAISLGIR